MRKFLIFLILCVLSFDISAQEIPSNNDNLELLDPIDSSDSLILYDSLNIIGEILEGYINEEFYYKGLETTIQLYDISSRLYGLEDTTTLFFEELFFGIANYLIKESENEYTLGNDSIYIDINK